jgi:hypothetical protein
LYGYNSNNNNKAGQWNRPNSWFKRNGRYLRFKTIQFGYTVPQRISQRIAMSKLRVYFAGQNLITFMESKELWDPETGQENFNFNFRARYAPQLKSYNFGVDITF